MAVLAALAAAMNPVALAQVDTFYNDGYLHLMLYNVVISLIMNADPAHRVSARTSASLIAAAMMVCANVKFTGLLYGGIYCIAYFLYGCVREKQAGGPDWLKKCTVRCALFALLAAVSIGAAGAPTYVTNLVHHHTLTYPLTGDEPEDIMTENSPFTEENRVKNLLISMFSRTCNPTYRSGSRPQLKVPFSWDSSELAYMNSYDNRIAGFGIFFSGMFSLSVLVIILKLWRAYRRKEQDAAFWSMNATVILFLCLLIQESWWARYAPYLYFLFLIGLYLSLDQMRNSFGRAAAAVLSVTMVLNAGLLVSDIPEEIRTTEAAHKLLVSFKKQEVVYVFSPRPGVYFNLMDHGVHFVIDGNLEKHEEAERFVWNRTKWSLEKPEALE